jgi:hypothetical protein
MPFGFTVNDLKRNFTSIGLSKACINCRRRKRALVKIIGD